MRMSFKKRKKGGKQEKRFAPLRRSLIGDTTHYLQGAAVLTGLLYHVVLYHVDSRARLAGSGAQGD